MSFVSLFSLSLSRDILSYSFSAAHLQPKVIILDQYLVALNFAYNYKLFNHRRKPAEVELKAAYNNRRSQFWSIAQIKNHRCTIYIRHTLIISKTTYWLLMNIIIIIILNKVVHLRQSVTQFTQHWKALQCQLPVGYETWMSLRPCSFLRFNQGLAKTLEHLCLRRLFLSPFPHNLVSLDFVSFWLCLLHMATILLIILQIRKTNYLKLWQDLK